MYNSNIKKSLVTVIAVVLFHFSSFSQQFNHFDDGKLRVSTSMGLGTCNLTDKYFEVGQYSLLLDLSFNIKNHNFGVYGGYASEIGSGAGMLQFAFLKNDKFNQLTFFYGRAAQYRRFNISLNAGPSLYKYKIRSKNYSVDDNLSKGNHPGIGLGIMGNIEFYTGQKQSIGVNSFININNTKTTRCFTLSYKYMIVG